MSSMPHSIDAIPGCISQPHNGGYWTINPCADGSSSPYVRGDIHDEAVRQRGRLLEACRAVADAGPVGYEWKAQAACRAAVAECEADSG